MNTAKKLIVLFVTAMAVQALVSCGAGTLGTVLKEQRVDGGNNGGNNDMKAN